MADVGSLVSGVRYTGGITNILDGINVANKQILQGPGSRQHAQKVGSNALHNILHCNLLNVNLD